MQEKDLLTYPVIIWAAEKGYNVFVPDLGEKGLVTQGTSLDNAIYMAGDLIGCMLADTTNYPKATPLDEVVIPAEAKNAITTIVSINIKEYRKRTSKTVRKTVSLPEYLVDLGKKEKINFSKILTEALENRLLNE